MSKQIQRKMKVAKMNRTKLLGIFLIIAFGFNLSYAQFGKNKVQYKDFKWDFIQSTYFDIYFYQGGSEAAEFVAVAAESAYASISNTFNYKIAKRIPIVLYNSHNDFQQTNITLGYLSEGIGGFTEIFKNRVVIPYDGSYLGFRHVLHHELVHAVVNDLFFGGNAQSIVAGAYTNLPLWWNEGLAEYESLDWDTQTDMYVRDAVISNYLPPITFLNGFMAYRGGQSVWKFIAEKYGKEKISEIIAKTKLNRNVNAGFKSAIGLDLEKLDKQWSKNLKKIYWPEVSNRLAPDDFAKKITDHEKEGGHYNLAPSFSPNGDKISLMTSRNDYADIYLISAIDGKILKKLVAGNRTESLEELKWLSPGMDWSPDGKQIVFASKSGDSDALQFVNVDNGNIHEKVFEELKFDAVSTSKWSNDGNKIVFVGSKSGASDIYLYNIKTDELENLTNDFFTDEEPTFSPDGKVVVFVSDRDGKPLGDKSVIGKGMLEHNIYNKDLYLFNLETKQLKRLTDSKWAENHPVFSPDGKFLAFTSDKNGISNIFLLNLEEENSSPYPITNVLTGCYQIDWSNDGTKIAFTSLYEGGWDIFLLSNPTEVKPDSIKLEDTHYLKLQKSKILAEQEKEAKKDSSETSANASKKDEKKESEISGKNFKNYVFAQGYENDTDKPEQGVYKTPVALSDSLIKDSDGDYKVNRYRLKFTPDYTGGAFGYDTFNGLQGLVSFNFSDIMGDHNFGMDIGFFVSLQNSDYRFTYAYLPRRIDWIAQAYHFADFYGYNILTRNNSGSLQIEEAIVRFRQIGVNIFGSYPISKFRRIDLGVDIRNQRRELISNLDGVVASEQDENLLKRNTTSVIPNVSYVRDSTLPGYTGPVDGWRYSLNYTGSPKFLGEELDFHTFTFDTRHYLRLTKWNSLAFRLSGGRSFGKNKQHFFLGGIRYWFNYDLANNENGGVVDELFSQSEEFFPYFLPNIRGADYYERIGDRFFVINSEFRHILIERFNLGFPPINFPPVFGAFFIDTGSAWYGDFNLNRRTTSEGELGGLPVGTKVFDDLLFTYGISSSIPLGFLFFKIDVAWLYDGHRTHKPRWLFSLGSIGGEF